jgi:hypothetical protein
MIFHPFGRTYIVLHVYTAPCISPMCSAPPPASRARHSTLFRARIRRRHRRIAARRAARASLDAFFIDRAREARAQAASARAGGRGCAID